MAKLQSVVGPTPETVSTVAFVQHPPDMVLVQEAEDTELKNCEAVDVIEEGRELVCDRSELICDGCESVCELICELICELVCDGCESVCDGCESVFDGSLSGLSGSSGPFGDGVYGGGSS